MIKTIIRYFSSNPACPVHLGIRDKARLLKKKLRLQAESKHILWPWQRRVYSSRHKMHPPPHILPAQALPPSNQGSQGGTTFNPLIRRHEVCRLGSPCLPTWAREGRLTPSTEKVCLNFQERATGGKAERKEREDRETNGAFSNLCRSRRTCRGP